MKKQLFLIGMIITVLISSMFIIPSIVNAAEVTSEKIVAGTDGSVEFIIKGLKLEEGKEYQWAIEKSTNATIENWYDITALDYNKGSVNIKVSVTNANQLAILKSVDTAYITIREKGQNTNILEGYKVDLTLPLVKAYVAEKVPRGYSIQGVYKMNNEGISYVFEQITDADIVNNYIDNDHDISGLNLSTISDMPALSDTRWKTVVSGALSGYIDNKYLPTENGLYYLWLRSGDSTMKTIVGYAIVEIGEVKKIEITKPEDNKKPENNVVEDKVNNTVDNNKVVVSNNTENNKVQKNNVIDNTVAKTTLPKAGKEIALAIVISAISIMAVIGYIKIKKYDDIK